MLPPTYGRYYNTLLATRIMHDSTSRAPIFNAAMPPPPASNSIRLKRPPFAGFRRRPPSFTFSYAKPSAMSSFRQGSLAGQNLSTATTARTSYIQTATLECKAQFGLESVIFNVIYPILRLMTALVAPPDQRNTVPSLSPRDPSPAAFIYKLFPP